MFLGYSYGHSTHFMGADISWECLGGDSFKITTRVYRDCNGVALTSTNTVVSGSCGTKTLKNTMVKGADITPVCRGVKTRCASRSSTYKFGFQEYILTSIVDLGTWRKSGCCEVTISWQQCCRNNGITTGPASQNMYVSAKMNICQSPCQSSPTWLAPPTNLLCTGKDASMNHGVKLNSSVDSVSYSMVAPKTSASGKVSWSGSFNYNKPLTFFGFPKNNNPFPRGFHLESNTGLMYFRPMKEEHTVMTMKVDLYKKGKKVGEMTRDIDVIIIKCPANNNPVISGINCSSGTSVNLSGSVCSGGTVFFKICTTDKDKNDSVSLNWNNGISGATFKVLNPGDKRETAEFCWTPKPSDAGREFSFVVTANDTKCPVPGTGTKTFKIKVTKAPSINPSIKVARLDQCGRYKMVMSEASKIDLGTVKWFVNDTIPIGTGDSIVHSFLQKGGYKVSGVIDSCHNVVLFDTVNVSKLSNLSLSNFDDLSICASQTLTLAPKVSGGLGSLTYQWLMDTIIVADSLTSPKTNLKFPNRFGPYRIGVEVTDATSGCSVGSEIGVLVKESKTTDVDQGESICLGQGLPISRKMNLINGFGEWTGTGVTENEFESKGLSSGTYTLHFSLEDSLSCNDDTAVFVLRDRPTVSTGGGVSSCLGANPIQLTGIPAGGAWDGKGIINANEFDGAKAGKGTHKLSYVFIDSFGCGDTAFVDAKVFDYKTIVTAPDSAYSCDYGSPFAITGSPKGGKWFGGGFASSGATLNIDPAVVGAGNYSIVYEYIDSNQCSGSDTSKVIIYEKPTASFDILDSIIDQNDPLPVKNNSYEVNGSEYIWIISAPTSKVVSGFQPTVVMDKLGMHDITLYATDTVSGCGDTLIRKSALRVVKIVGLEQDAFDDIQLYPNPVENILFIQNNLDELVEMEILSLNGQVIIQQRINPGMNSVETLALPSGMHQVTLTDKQMVRKTVIMKK